MRPNWRIATPVRANSWVQPIRAIFASDWKEYGVQVIVRSSGFFDTVRNPIPLPRGRRLDRLVMARFHTGFRARTLRWDAVRRVTLFFCASVQSAHFRKGARRGTEH
jgi:hypothetical protein